MSNNCCSRNFSSSESFYSTSTGGTQSFPVSSCGSSFPNVVVYNTDLTSPRTTQLGTPLSIGCQETCCEPSIYQVSRVSRVVSSPCQTSCFRPRPSALCSPCLPSCSRPRPAAVCSPCGVTYSGSQGCGSSSSCSQVYQSGSSYSVGSGSASLRPLAFGIREFPSLSLGSGVCGPISLTPGNCQSSC
ncbi:keratin-associated protein 13-1-like [Talpa occidentalis]|uniref:keratin-associated protein 13-1-like n=1 Tax=Talpa occidentalis TaxID=50954 RepID=UPI00188F76EB|nr:keratin-associated protein 13-1-like [Talpa occidentalis]